MGYFKHKLALVESAAIGDGTRISAFSHILPGATIGRNCTICDHTFVEGGAVVGDRVTLQCGVHLWDGIVIEDDVFIGPNAAFSKSEVPRGDQSAEGVSTTIVRRGASIGANATILPGVVIGQDAIIGAGAVVTRNVPQNTILNGNPAGITGYVGTRLPVLDRLHIAQYASTVEPPVLPAKLHHLPLVDDVRGLLSFGEMGRHVPFEVKRYFIVFGVSNQEIRGEHAHRTLHQFLICVHGRCHLAADDGVNRHEFVLDHPTLGLHVPPLVWGVQYKYSADAVLLVLASDYYDPADYIREYSDFLALVRTRE